MKEKVKDKLSLKKKNKKKEFEKQFYYYYFREIAENEQLPIESFFHPKNSQACKNSRYKNLPKTINQQYIMNISKSKEFINEFKFYLNNHLLRDYRVQIDQKFYGLISKWETQLSEETSHEQVLKNILFYINENKKCKLPWNLKEIQEAILSVNKLFA